MALENIRIQSTRNGVSPVVGPREDAVALDVIQLSLTDTRGVSTCRWELVGRPEFSTVGGSSLPATLGTGLTASFTVSTDSGAVDISGTYVIHAVLNEGSPSGRRVTTFIARSTGLTVPGLVGNVPLRKVGAFESLEDTLSIPNIIQGWATMLNRWMEFVRLNTGGGPGTVTLAAAYSAGSLAAHQTLALRDANGGAFTVDGSNGLFTGTNTLNIINPGGLGVRVVRATGLLSVDSGAVDFGDGLSMALSAAGRARLRWNNSTKRMEYSGDGAGYVGFSSNVTITSGQVAVGTGVDTIGGSNNLIYAAGALKFANGSAGVGAVSLGTIKYHEGVNKLQWNQNNGTYKNFDAWETATITAGSGLTGGGALLSNPTISMPAVGPGAGLIGGSGIASVTLDAQGRVTAVSSASYVLSGGLGGYMPTSWTLTAGAGLTGGGDGTVNRSIAVATGGITNAMIRDSAALSLLGRAGATPGSVADIVAAADGQYMRRASGSLAFGAIADADLPSTIARVSSMAAGRVAVGNGSNALIGYSGFTYDNATATLSVARANLAAGVFADTSGTVNASNLSASFNSASGTADFRGLYILTTFSRAASTGPTYSLLIDSVGSVTSGAHYLLRARNLTNNATFGVLGDGTLSLLGGTSAGAGTGTLGYNTAANRLEYTENGGAVQRFVPESRTFTAGSGLAGGGDFSANRTISMPATGPGAGLIGGSGIASITLDAQGRVTAATTASYGGGFSIAINEVAYAVTTNGPGGDPDFTWNSTSNTLNVSTLGGAGMVSGIRATFSVYNSDGLFNAAAVPFTVRTPNLNSSFFVGYDDTGATSLYQAAIGFDVTVSGAAADLRILRARARTEANDRFSVSFNGLHSWGPGGVTVVDTTLARTGVGNLAVASGTSNISIAVGPGQIAHTFLGEANQRWSLSRDAVGGGLAGMVFGPGGASTLAATGAGVGLVSASRLGFYLGVGGVLTQTARMDTEFGRFRLVFPTSTASHISFSSSQPVADPTLNLNAWKIVLWDNGSTAGSYGLGVEGNNLWQHSASGFKWYMAGTNYATFDSVGRLRIGTAGAPNYTLDAVATGRSQIRFGANNADSGGFLYSDSALNALLTAGVAVNASVWTAKAANTSIFGLDNATAAIYFNTALSPGDVFTPSAYATWNLSTYTVQNGGPTASRISMVGATGIVQHIVSGEANPRYEVGPSIIGAGFSGMAMGPGGGSTIAAAGSAIIGWSGQLGAYVTNGSVLNQATRWDFSGGRYRQIFAQNPSHITFSATANGQPNDLNNWKVLLWDGGSTAGSYGMGLEGSYTWVHAGSALGGFKIYANHTLMATFAAGNLTLSQFAQSGGISSPVLLTNTGNMTNLIAGLEYLDVDFNLGHTVNRLAGGVSLQRAMVIRPPTYSFASLSTITQSATMAITGAPGVGAFAIITERYSLFVQSGFSRFDGAVGINAFPSTSTTAQLVVLQATNFQTVAHFWGVPFSSGVSRGNQLYFSMGSVPSAGGTDRGFLSWGTTWVPESSRNVPYLTLRAIGTAFSNVDAANLNLLADGNVYIFSTSATTTVQNTLFVSFGSVHYVQFANSAVPSFVAGSGIMYGEGGAIKAKGGGGTTTTVAAAEPHCPVCTKDFVVEWENPKYGHLMVCMDCLAAEVGPRPFIKRVDKLAA